MRVGEFKKVWLHEDSKKLLCEEINLGKETRLIASGVQQQVSIGDMKGLCVAVYNLKPRKLAGFSSNGMVLFACSADHTQIELIIPPDGSEVGSRLYFEGDDIVKNSP